MPVKQLSLLDVPKDHPSIKAKIAEFKKANCIWTNSSQGMPEGAKWIAMLMPSNPHKIKLPYGNDETDPWELFAGYCRILEESGFLVDASTEREAIRLLCQNVGIPCDL